MKRNGKQPTTLPELEAQRQDLAGRLAALGAQLARLDPVGDWQLVARALGERQALELAVTALDERIEAARREQAAGAAGAREQERQERAAAARINLERAARAVCGAVIALDNGVLAELRAAARELGAAGGWPDPAAGVALRLAGAVDGSLAQFRLHAPTWLGLPEPMTAEQSALLDRTTAVAVAEARLQALKDLRNKAKHGAARPDDALITQVAFGVQGTRLALLKLTEPDLSPDEALARSCAGVAELAGWYGNVREAKDDAQRKAAAGALMA